MALTITKVDELHSVGSLRMQVADVAFDDSYPTGGEPLTAADLGFQSLVVVLVEPAAGYSFEYDHTNSKLIARYADYDAGADGPLIQVPDTTDLAAVTGVRVVAFGRS